MSDIVKLKDLFLFQEPKKKIIFISHAASNNDEEELPLFLEDYISDELIIIVIKKTKPELLSVDTFRWFKFNSNQYISLDYDCKLYHFKVDIEEIVDPFLKSSLMESFEAYVERAIENDCKLFFFDYNDRIELNYSSRGFSQDRKKDSIEI